MKILFRFFLIIFSFSFFACKRDTVTQNQVKLTPPLSDSVLLRQADSLYNLAETITDLKKSDSALSFHQRALATREKFLTNDIRLLNSNYKVGMIYYQNNKYDVADKYLESARRIAEVINPPISVIYNIYTNLSVCKREAKDFPTAISIVQRLLHVIKERDPNNKTMTARAYDRLAGIYHYSNQEDKAFENWLISVSLTPSNNHELLGQLYFNISIGYNLPKQFAKSLAYINKSIQQDLIWAGPNSAIVAGRYLRKAFILLEMDEMDSVLYLLHKTLRIRRQVFGEKDPNTYGAKLVLGDFYYKIHQYDSSVYYHHQSLISLIKSFNNSDLFSNPQPEQDELNMDIVNGLINKAVAVKKLFDTDTSKTELLDLVLNTYLLADSVFAGYRKNILHDDPLLRQLEGQSSTYPEMLSIDGQSTPYPEMFNIALKLFKLRKTNAYLEKCLRVMESSRAVVLQNALNRALAFHSAGISDSLLKRGNRFNRLREELLQQMSNANLPQHSRDSLNEELLVADNQQSDFQDELKKTNPNFFSVRDAHLPNINEIKNFLAEKNSVYLEYMWSDSSIYGLMVSPDLTQIKSIPVTRKFRETFSGFINEFRADPEGAIETGRYKKFCSNASTLYNQLIKGFIEEVKPNVHLIISAEGPLATIPFDALITRLPNSDEVNYHLPYLLLEHPISYAYSAGVLLKQSAHTREGKKLLAFGYAGGGPALTTRSGLTNLPGTEKEIGAIKDVMKNHVNQYRLQSDASESFFKLHVSDFDIVHLALHGEGDTLNALNSRLIFRSDSDKVEDGSLYAHELYDLKLDNLDLAVLSACESGVGKQQRGEGVMSIARGFAYAGCPSMVISLWKINDRTSAQVMKGFYNYIQDGEPLDLSLAKAKGDYLKGAREFSSHPFYWAAFLQVGEASALDIKKPNGWGWVLGLGVAGAVIFFFVNWWRGSSHQRKSHSQ